MPRKTRKTTDAQARATEKYAKLHTKHYGFKLVDTTDADIIAKLDSLPNKQGYIKAAIREYMAKH